MKTWKERLRKNLEPKLARDDPRPEISSYHDMPYAIFRYDPDDEFALRQEVSLLKTRLEQQGKRVTVISLAERLETAMERAGLAPERVAATEKRYGTSKMVDTVHVVLSKRQPLDELVAEVLPDPSDPMRDMAFLTRAGALFPMYRTSSLLEQLKGKVTIPAILFYPGHMEGAAGLQFMGVLEAEHNYRPKIF